MQSMIDKYAWLSSTCNDGYGKFSNNENFPQM